MPERICYYGCGATTDLRPYGPGGTWICFPCMQAEPERARAASSAFLAQIDAAQAVSPHGFAVLDLFGESGPEPYLGTVDPDAPLVCSSCGQYLPCWHCPEED